LIAAKDTNCESATVAEVISSNGNHSPPLIILAGKTIQKHWIIQTDVPGNYMFAAMDTAFINDQLMLAWIIKFEEWSSKKQIGRNRLLLLDSYTSHFTRQFIEFCDDHCIILFATIPHTMHIYQPLDISVFQPYKQYYASAVARAFRNSCTEFDKLQFLSNLHQVRIDTFKRSTILSAWRKARLIPFDPDIVLAQIHAKLKPACTPILEPTYIVQNLKDLHIPKKAKDLQQLFDWLNREEWDDDIQEDMWFMAQRGALAMVTAGEVAQREALCRTAAMQKRDNMH
jgi:hypothetical protein